MMMTAVNNARRIVSGTYFPIKLNQASVKKAFTEHVLPICCPHWKIEHVDCTHLADGVTNMLVAVSRGPTITPEYLMRVNGHYTELYLDREYEVAVIHALGKAGIGPALHCQFDNGLCYGFIPGRMLELEELCDPVMSYKIAARLAYFHSTSPPPICGKVTGQARIFQTLTDWMAWIESTTKVTERFTQLYGSIESLKHEIEVMKEELSKFVSPVVLCHNDLQCRNILYDERDGSIKFIDFEYSGMNSFAFDIGNFFNEFAGIDDVDFNRYPSEEFQKWWIRIYLEESAKLKGDSPSVVTREQVDVVFREANISALASNLKWALWSILQDQFSTIEMDYLQYGAIRLNEYKSKKEKYLAL